MRQIEVYLTIETSDDIETFEARLTHEVFKLLRRDERLLGWQIGGEIDLFDPPQGHSG